MSQVHQTVTTTERTKSETRISGYKPHIRLQANGRETVEQTELVHPDFDYPYCDDMTANINLL